MKSPFKLVLGGWGVNVISVKNIPSEIRLSIIFFNLVGPVEDTWKKTMTAVRVLTVFKKKQRKKAERAEEVIFRGQSF